ncbi:MAG: phosphopantothenoylcysteine synthase, partial [Firmicutes bacterium]|nr:phosphopantothenoylcysteine synthase [Bacillota bacterium]
KLAPEAVIVGFKLLDEVKKKELLDTAKRLMEKNDCDFVLANDYKTVQKGADKHVGYLMSRGGKVETFTGKQAIADGIAGAVEKIWKEEVRK